MIRKQFGYICFIARSRETLIHYLYSKQQELRMIKSTQLLLSQAASSFDVPQADERAGDTRIDLPYQLRCKDQIKKINYMYKTGKKEKERTVHTSIWPIIDHNPEAIVKSFLFCNELCCIKKTTKNLTMPLLSLHDESYINNKCCYNVVGLM